MLSKTITNQTLKLIDRYLNFRLQDKDESDEDTNKENSQNKTGIHSKYSYSESAIPVSVPYFNNRRRAMAIGLRGAVGKGTPDEIAEEIEINAQRSRFPLEALCSSLDIQSGVPAIKRFMVDRDIGIDCSGLVYHLLNSETRQRSGKDLSRELESVANDKSFLHYIHLDKIYSALRFLMRPAENTDVRVLANSKNSKVIPLDEVAPGDFITILNKESQRNHVIFIHRVDYNPSPDAIIPHTIHYTHSINWPSDGKYNHGVRQGTIQITDLAAPISAQTWTEQDKTGSDNGTWNRIQESGGNVAELRRLAF